MSESAQFEFGHACVETSMLKSQACRPFFWKQTYAACQRVLNTRSVSRICLSTFVCCEIQELLVFWSACSKHQRFGACVSLSALLSGVFVFSGMVISLRLQNPGSRNRKPRVFINRHPLPPSRPPKTSCKIAKDPPLLVWECIGVHSTMERSAEASFGGRMGRFGGGSGWQFMKTREVSKPGVSQSLNRLQVPPTSARAPNPICWNVGFEPPPPFSRKGSLSVRKFLFFFCEGTLGKLKAPFSSLYEGNGGFWSPNLEKDATPYKSLRALRARSPPRSA